MFTQTVFGVRACVLASAISLFPALAHADQIISRNQRGGLDVKVSELQKPGAPVHGVSLQAAHELSVQATQTGVRINGLEIIQGINLDRGSVGNAIQGYIYLDAMPQKTLKATTLAEDSSRPFSWSYRIRYNHNGQNLTLDGSVTSSTPAKQSSGTDQTAVDVGALLDATPPTARSGTINPSGPVTADAGLDVNALFGGPPPASPAPVRSAAARPAPRTDSVEAALGLGPDTIAPPPTGETNSGSRVDDALGDALALRDQERERKAYVAHAENLRSSLIEQQSLQNRLIAEVSREHQQIDQRRAEAERRRQAQAESSRNNRLLLGLIVGGTAAVAGARAGMQNAGEMAGRLGASIANGNAGAGMAEYSAAMNRGMNQRLAELEQQNRQTLASSQSQRMTEGQRLYRESVQRSEAGRQQLIAQGKLRDAPPPPSVTAALNNSQWQPAPTFNSGSSAPGSAGSSSATYTGLASGDAQKNVQRVEFRPDCQVRMKLKDFEGEVTTRNTMVHSISYLTEACLAAKKNFIEAYACNMAERMDSARAQCSSACGDPTCRSTR